MERDAGLTSEHYANDGTGKHPNDEGYIEMADEWWKALTSTDEFTLVNFDYSNTGCRIPPMFLLYWEWGIYLPDSCGGNWPTYYVPNSDYYWYLGGDWLDIDGHTTIYVY